MAFQIYGKTVNSMQKVFPCEEPLGEEIKKVVLQNERVNFQLVYKNDSADSMSELTIEIRGKLAPYAEIRSVELVPANYFYRRANDDYIISDKPGVYPDLLKPLGKTGVVLPASQWKAFYVSVECPEGFPAGKYNTTFALCNEKKEVLTELNYTINILPIRAEEIRLKTTNWMHYDGIVAQHGVELFSDAFYKVFEGYLREYVRGGNNMLFTPLFTPPLDTKIGGERRTAQLVGVKKYGDYRYEFDFAKLEKFIRFALSKNIKYVEFSHLFTQWGGKNCPKIIAETELGRTEKIFGWETSSTSENYLMFLDAFLKNLVQFIDKNGWREICYFHLTDEPRLEHLETYKALREFVKTRIGNMRIIDALSNYEFFEKGGVDVPAPLTLHFEKFANKGIEELFCYYCCGPYNDYYSNRLLNMPLQRTKVIGLQLYETNVQGFLHWGFNFYNTARSLEEIDPFADTAAGGLFPSGDSFVVYPDRTGSAGAYGSLRLETLGEAFFEYRVLQTLESLAGRKKVLKILHDFGVFGFEKYPRSDSIHDAIRTKIYSMLKKYYVACK